MWGALLAVLLLPLWLFPYIPTQDGPAHLETAATLLALKDSNFLGGFYDANWRLATNQVYHALLVALGSFLPLLLAEKLVLSAYALLVPAATLFALRGLPGASRFGVFLIFPVVYAYVFYLGFYNLAFGLPLFLLALGLYFRLAGLEDSPGRTLTTGLMTVLLAATLVLSYFVHIMAAASTLLALAVMTTVRLVGRGDIGGGNRRTLSFSALAAAPTLALMGFFFVTTPGAMPTEATNFLNLPELLQTFFVHPPNLTYALYSPLVLHTWLDAVFTLPLYLLLVALTLVALVQGLKGRVPAPELSAALLVFVFIIVWSPNRLGEVGWLPDRFLPYGYALLVLWLATAPLSARGWRVVSLTSLSLWGALSLYRLPVHAALNSSVQEYVEATQVIQEDSTVLPLSLSQPVLPNLQALYPNLRYDAVRHALGYAALDKRIVNLANYQAAKGYFPLRYKDARNPAVHLSEGGLGALEYPPFSLDIAAYRRETGAAVDYVIFWGELDAERGRDDVRRVLQQLTDYELVYARPRAHVYALEGRETRQLGQLP